MIDIVLRAFFDVISVFIPVKNKILFASFGGRNFDDSPRALFQEMRARNEFGDYEFVWAFREPEKWEIEGARRVKIDTPRFFYELLSSRIWISNSGIDRGLELHKKKHISVETWHGCPLKKICGEENRGGVLNENYLRPLDATTIRCAQSAYDRDIFSRVFNADPKCFLLTDLPRNDELTRCTDRDIAAIKSRLGVPAGKKLILYMPTYREYWIDQDSNIYMKSLINIEKWKNTLGSEYMLLVRAHYAVSKALQIENDDFCINVSDYPKVNELYEIADVLISDYSSAFFDYSILGRPMLCYASDYEEYNEQRGLYVDLQEVLPCPVDHDEDTLLDRLKTLDYAAFSDRTKRFSEIYTPCAGQATQSVVSEILKRASG